MRPTDSTEEWIAFWSHCAAGCSSPRFAVAAGSQPQYLQHSAALWPKEWHAITVETAIPSPWRLLDRHGPKLVAQFCETGTKSWIIWFHNMVVQLVVDLKFQRGTGIERYPVFHLASAHP